MTRLLYRTLKRRGGCCAAYNLVEGRRIPICAAVQESRFVLEIAKFEKCARLDNRDPARLAGSVEYSYQMGDDLSVNGDW